MDEPLSNIEHFTKSISKDPLILIRPLAWKCCIEKPFHACCYVITAIIAYVLTKIFLWYDINTRNILILDEPLSNIEHFTKSISKDPLNRIRPLAWKCCIGKPFHACCYVITAIIAYVLTKIFMEYHLKNRNILILDKPLPNIAHFTKSTSKDPLKLIRSLA